MNTFKDILSGISVALVLIPGSMAYADLAGLPPEYGWISAIVAPIAASFFTSSPILQTGPTALAALLTFSTVAPLAQAGSKEFALFAALLALSIGIVRIAIGFFGGGWISYLLSRPVLDGFTSAAGVLIVASQLPAILGLGIKDRSTGVLESAVVSVVTPGAWHVPTIMISVLTVLIVLGSRRIHVLIPGVLMATVFGIIYSKFSAYNGPTIGDIDITIPYPNLYLPWGELHLLIIPSIVIALVSFAEVAAISSKYAKLERVSWSPDREFISQGAANVAAGLFGGFPVGGSFVRSSLNYSSGARSRLSGAVAGLVVLLCVPFAGLLSELPRAILAAIVFTAAVPLIQFRFLVYLWGVAPLQAGVAWTTFVLTLVLSPHVEQAVLLGIIAAVSVHIWRELNPSCDSWAEGDSIHVRLSGVLWFGSAAFIQEAINETLPLNPRARRFIIDLTGVGRVDFTGALALKEFREEAAESGIHVELVGIPHHAGKILGRVG